MTKERKCNNGKVPETPLLPEQICLARYWSWALNVTLILSCAFIIFCRLLVVRGPSMESTYFDGDLLIGLRVFNKDTLLDKDYPVCVAVSPDGTNVIKRLIGKPGDTVELIEGDTYVNGEKIMSRTTDCWDNMTFTCGEDEWLFMGDNRAASFDGRYWPGNGIHLSDIKFYVLGSELILED